MDLMSLEEKKQTDGQVNGASALPSGGREQMIIFTVGDQRYCIPILSIKEIREFEDPTYLPHCPAYVEGAINIRGNIVTVVNLANYLGAVPEADNERRVVIIIEDGQNRATCGLLVDSVIGITEIALDEIQPISVDGGAAELSGLVSIGERVIRILRLDTVLTRLLGDGAVGTAAG
ncbi:MULTISPECIES: chemotaxis protein CheW [Acetobacteraceae]|uniref:Positive regulator of CheA protein activity (CheW) n=3 Tax=Acetobacteraceae TaxID=433 RepID=A0A7U7J0I2_9PROT|nr:MULTISPECIES: chemotaxis protein CheW [Acetobacteraceae]MCQ0040880.1 chemotaxis protein CheW [Bombella sp.]MCT6813906.1 chemotaxis protein CheW [Bombella apis]MCT6819450.1 chemotaxis protein CheW [Bombella apis]MCT6845727.1 chemotaxis protein CheW [Bombella apis]CDG33082.1 Positive regulator of CheA protein activity (CheW) [Parasaccharibacter apium]